MNRKFYLGSNNFSIAEFFWIIAMAIHSRPIKAEVDGNRDSVCFERKPHIIFIMADDAGWNDFSFHGSPQIPTPNIDALALNGMILNSYYGSPLCTPTRGAIMTGKHPIHLGLQHFVIMGQSADGLPLGEKLLPQYLKELGYATHLIGKWHLGHSRKAFTPTRRGFDSHFGYWLGKQDYYDHFSLDGSKKGWGYDFRSNLTVNYDVFGKYDTDIFTEESIRIINQHGDDAPLFLMINHIAPHSANAYKPLQAPPEYIDKFKSTIADKHRRIYAAMVDKLDESVGLVVKALKRKGMLQNSIIVFASDNGGAPEGFDLNYGSNWPLRGIKNTLWEGGTRLASLVWSPFTQNRVSNDMFHVQNWLPTLYEAAGGNPSNLGTIDGQSMWKTLTNGDASPMNKFLYNIDDIYNNSALRFGKWKLIQGHTTTRDLSNIPGASWDFWYGPSGRSNALDAHSFLDEIINSNAGRSLENEGFTFNKTRMREVQDAAEVHCNSGEVQVPCNPYETPCLFDIEDDPCEQRNLASENPEVVSELLQLLADFNKTAIPPIPRIKDPDGDPVKWNHVWTTWKDNLEETHLLHGSASY